MLKNLVIHPFLFSLFPVLVIFQYNIHEIPLQDTFWPLFVSFIIALGLWVLIRFFIGSKKSGLIVSLIIMLFVIFSIFIHVLHIQHYIMFILFFHLILVEQ